ncbi:hypothetical protein [Streptomyces sp. NPDC023838]|uniref:hypothetical protein n=1 Tax=Streptomyces sp. NPDC023838 TaxID=3154325 RepID=UPI0033F15C89
MVDGSCPAGGAVGSAPDRNAVACASIWTAPTALAQRTIKLVVGVGSGPGAA